jgi:hypothetical protein
MKLNIRKKLVSLAVASVVTGGAMMAIPAQAMNISQNNIGQVLLFPYYNVKAGYDTILSVVNTSDKTAVFKIRFRESSDSDEVRDFNVILSPHDVWNGAVTAGETQTLFRTYDKSCTSPLLPGMQTQAERAAEGSKGEVPFASGGNISNNTEGYFEIILMGVADPVNNTGAAAVTLQAGALHNAAGVPANCAAVDALFANNLTTTTLDSEMSAPENILKGSVTLINVTAGIAFAPEPTAIENFQTGQAIVSAPSDLRPDLTDGDAVSNAMFFDNGVLQDVVGIVGSENAVSALLTYGAIADEYISGTNAGAAWVITLPTKHHYAGPSTCYEIAMSLYNREEKTTIVLDSTNFSPFNPVTNSVDLCSESTVLNFNGVNIFGEANNRLDVDTSSVGLQGWANIHFVDAQPNTTSVVGLPVIGFAALGRDSGDATTNYGTTESFTGTRVYLTAP